MRRPHNMGGNRPTLINSRASPTPTTTHPKSATSDLLFPSISTRTTSKTRVRFLCPLALPQSRKRASRQASLRASVPTITKPLPGALGIHTGPHRALVAIRDTRRRVGIMAQMVQQQRAHTHKPLQPRHQPRRSPTLINSRFVTDDHTSHDTGERPALSQESLPSGRPARPCTCVLGLCCGTAGGIRDKHHYEFRCELWHPRPQGLPAPDPQSAPKTRLTKGWNTP